MQINSYNSSQISQNYIDRSKSNKVQIEKKDFNQIAQPSKNLVSTASSNTALISSQERDFFKSLFPENSEQIEKHVVFNRNGKVNSFSLAKGLIVDSRA